MGVSHLHLLAQLGAGDLEGYRRGCQGLLDRIGAVVDPDTANKVAWVVAMGPGASADERSLKLAEQAVKRSPANPSYLGTLGAVQSRASRFNEAIETLTRVIQARGRATEVNVALSDLFLAMARERLGHSEEARGCLVQAEARIEQLTGAMPGGAAGGTRLAWPARLELRLLRGEAEALIRRGAATGASPSPKAR
jgi:hypothetical protein